MIQGNVSHLLSCPHHHRYQQSSRITSGRVQVENVNSALAGNDAAVELLRRPSEQHGNEVEALSILQWATQSLLRPILNEAVHSTHPNQRSSHSTTSDGNHGDWAQENPNADLIVDNNRGAFEVQATARMIDANGLEGGLGFGADRQSCNNSSASSGTTSSPNSAGGQLLSPQGILPLDGAALSLYLSSTLTRHELMVHSVNADAAFDNCSCCSGPKNQPSILSTVSMADEMDLHSSPGNLFSVYNRPFVVNQQWRGMDVFVWSQSLPHISTVLHFNIGLVYHRLACRSGASHHYYQALEWYENAALLLEGNALAGVYLIELDILLLAIMNNMGHVHSHFNNLEQAQHIMKRMLTVFFLSESKSLMTKDEYVFFYTNIVLSVQRFPLLPGAA